MMPSGYARSNTRTMLLASLAALLTLTACNDDGKFDGFAGSDPFDRGEELTRDDYRDMNRAEKLLPGQESVTATLGAPPIPDVAQVIAAPRPPKVANSKLVSIAVTDDVPLRDVLFELGRLADVDIEIGPGLDARGVNLRASNRPFNEVIERISDLAGLRYSVKNGSLRVEQDTPYFKNYPLDFLNIIRSGTSSVNVSSNVLSAGTGVSGSSGGESSSSSSSSSGGSSGGSGVTTGTSSSISSSAESDLWSSLSSSIGDILQSTATASTVATDSSAGAAEAAPTAASGGANFVINRQAGVLSVNGTERQHDKVALFLSMLERNASAQVLIEAKIVEVTLADQFQSGVNWTNIIGELGDTNISLGNYVPAPQTGFSLANNGALTLSVEGGSLDAILQLTQRFGTTRTLSSPRLHAINNQPSVLTFAQNRVVQSCTVEQGSETLTAESGAESSTGPSITCTVSTIPIGILLNILPSVNLDSQEVTLNVRPTLSRQVTTVDNISTLIALASVPNGGGAIPNFEDLAEGAATIPVVEVREIDSVMKIRSGAVMVIGGLMEDISTNEDRGVPGISSIPWVGNAFKSRSESSSKRELIIFIKATIVNSSGSASGIDRGVYEKYGTDPRPLF